MTPRIHKDLRGRPSGISTQDYSVLESLALIASKHGIDPKQLIDTFFEGWKNGTSRCGQLKVVCRAVNHDAATFLITKDENVVWQFQVNLEVLRNADIRDFINTISLPETVKIDNSNRTMKINQLRFGMKRINTIARIVEIPPAKQIVTRWGIPAYVSNIKIEDETGAIRLSLWNEQIKTVQIGDEVEIKNCSVSKFADEPQLRLGRKGVISIIN